MKKPALDSKRLLNLSETITFYRLSYRKFHKMLKAIPQPPFITWYHTNRLIIRSEFEAYMQSHPDTFQWIKKDESLGRKGGSQHGRIHISEET